MAKGCKRKDARKTKPVSFPPELFDALKPVVFASGYSMREFIVKSVLTICDAALNPLTVEPDVVERIRKGAAKIGKTKMLAAPPPAIDVDAVVMNEPNANSSTESSAKSAELNAASAALAEILKHQPKH
jgi:hypothetical protein